MKKLLAFLLVFAMLLSLVACGGTTDTENKGNSTQNDGNSENNGSIQVDEGLFTVDITMPASFFDGQTEDEIKAAAEENG